MASEGAKSIRLSGPRPELRRAVRHLLERALECDHEVAKAFKRGDTSKAKKVDDLCKLLGLGDRPRWHRGYVRVVRRENGEPGFRYHCRDFNLRLTSLLEGTPKIPRSDDANARRETLEFAQALPEWWRRDPATRHSPDDVLKWLAADLKRLDREIGELPAEQALSERDMFAAGPPEVPPLAPLSALPRQQDLVGMHAGSGVAPPDAAATGDHDPQPGILRLVAAPLGAQLPRPVNLCMSLGVSRRSMLVILVGANPESLLEDLTRTEAIARRVSGEAFGARAWRLEPPSSPDEVEGVGWIQQPALPLVADDIWLTLSTVFDHPARGCGDVLVFALPPGAHALASSLVDLCARGRDASPSARLRRIPIYLWDVDAAKVAGAEPALMAIEDCLASGVCEGAVPDVAAVFGMRNNASATLPAAWLRADGEQIRLHDLSVVLAERRRAPTHVDEARAVELLGRADENPNLLYAVPFLPVSERVIEALSHSPPLTRDVAGWLTKTEAMARRVPWRRRAADGYRPATAAPEADCDEAVA